MTKLKVEGMSCDHCVHTVTKALASVPGVVKVVGVNLERGEATVEGQPDSAQLIAAVEQEGYKAHLA